MARRLESEDPDERTHEEKINFLADQALPILDCKCFELFSFKVNVPSRHQAS